MAYLNNELSIKCVHAELTAVRNCNVWGEAILQIDDNVFYIRPHKNGIYAENENGEKVCFSKLKDFDYAENNSQALDLMLTDLMDNLEIV